MRPGRHIVFVNALILSLIYLYIYRLRAMSDALVFHWLFVFIHYWMKKQKLKWLCFKRMERNEKKKNIIFFSLSNVVFFCFIKNGMLLNEPFRKGIVDEMMNSSYSTNTIATTYAIIHNILRIFVRLDASELAPQKINAKNVQLQPQWTMSAAFVYTEYQLNRAKTEKKQTNKETTKDW